VKTSEFKRWLRGEGVRLVEGSKHTKAYLGDKQTTVPRHTEISNALVKAICKQLGLSM